MDKKKIYKNYLIAELRRMNSGLKPKHLMISIPIILVSVRAFYWILADLMKVPDIEKNMLLMIFFVIVLGSSGAVGGTSSKIETERKAGTLEQLCISPVSFYLILFTRSIIELVRKPILTLIAVQLFIWTNQLNLSFNHLDFLFIFFLTILPLIGIGYLLAGVSLLAKGFSQTGSIIVFFMLGGMAITVYPFNAFSLMPFFPQIATLKLVFLEGKEFESVWYLYLMGNSLFYLTIGVFCFIKLEYKARKWDKFFKM